MSLIILKIVNRGNLRIKNPFEIDELKKVGKKYTNRGL